jgi:hypothetical protein
VREIDRERARERNGGKGEETVGKEGSSFHQYGNMAGEMGRERGREGGREGERESKSPS